MPICCGHQQNCSIEMAVIVPLRAKPLRADKHSVIVYVSKRERVQYECSVYHCLSPFLQEKTSLERFFFPPVLKICFTKTEARIVRAGGREFE